MDYTNGKIYKIWNSVNDEIYVGSTCQPLSKRMAEHRRCVTTKAAKHRPLYKLMNEQGIDTFYIELVVACPCNNVEELRKAEGGYIREMATLNMPIAGRTQSEYKQDNKDNIVEQSKVYYEQHREQIMKYQNNIICRTRIKC